jgi:hypothetical protein
MRLLSRAFLFAPLIIPAPLIAQSDVRTVVMAAQPARYEPAACGIKTGHFKVGSGATYLSTAITNEANRERLLSDAEKVLVEAIRDNGQASNPAAWYYLGRVYLYEGNVIGADTAFGKAETLAPACKDEILLLRRATAGALQEPAGLLLQAEKMTRRWSSTGWPPRFTRPARISWWRSVPCSRPWVRRTVPSRITGGLRRSALRRTAPP